MDRKERLLVLAKKWFLEYMEDGEVRMPSDFDEDFLGGLDITGTFGVTAMAWDKTPFYRVLGDLVESGEIKYWVDDSGNHCYQLNA